MTPLFFSFFVFQYLQTGASGLIFISGIIALLWALIQFRIIAKIPVRSIGATGEEEGLVSGADHEHATVRLNEIYTAIYEGAESFLRAEYTVCFYFVIAFAALIFVLVSWGTGWGKSKKKT